MRILHTSDWHLGRMLHEHSLIEDQEHALSRILDIIRHDPHDVLIVAGDVFDRSIPSIEAVTLLSRFFSELRACSSIPVVLIPGNHDSAARLSYCSDLMSLSRIHIRGGHHGAEKPVVITGGDEECHIYAVPFLDASVQHEYSNGEEPDERPTHEGALRSVLDGILPNMDTGAVNIFTGHLFTAGGVTAESERSFIGTAGLVNPVLLRPFTYAALGHLHRPQQVDDSVWYSGSLLKYSFSECGDKKQVLSVELDASGARVRPLYISPLRDMSRLKGGFEQLLQNREFAASTDHYVEAELTDKKLVTSPLSLLKQRFPYILSVKQAPPQTGFSSRGLNAFRAERSVEDDFAAFHQYLYGSDADGDKRRLFNETLRNMHTSETA